MAYEIIDADYVLDNLDTMRIVDVRPDFMYEESRIPGAVSIQLMKAKEDPGDTASVFVQEFFGHGFKPEDEFIVYCYDGGLAREACGYLEEKGFTGHKCYEGSWIDWISDDSRPIDTDPK